MAGAHAALVPAVAGPVWHDSVRAAIIKGEVPDRAALVEPGRHDRAAEAEVRAKAAPLCRAG
ncbi:MAG TPA: hypothetical protein VE733_21985 [Streptosporangiaceae bacterium]|nr:hypothetical protein [Streptosporangiaceae bacterium]